MLLKLQIFGSGNHLNLHGRVGMRDIEAITHSFPIVKPKKIKRDDNRPKKQPPGKKQQVEEPDVEPLQHIDEIV
jgi:hypothetical protein